MLRLNTLLMMAAAAIWLMLPARLKTANPAIRISVIRVAYLRMVAAVAAARAGPVIIPNSTR